MRTTDRPNLLVLMSDQHRADWLGSQHASWVQTPNLDRLAQRGIAFSQATCNSPICAPSRISLATGLRPHRLGALNNSAFLPRGVPTFYQALRDHGYRVGFVGKIDLHKPDPFNGRHGNLPITYTYGFTDPCECEGKMHAGTGWPHPHGPYNHYLAEHGLLERFCADYRMRAREKPLWYAADSVLPTEHYEDVFIGRHACEFLANVSDESPWHLFVSFVGPHNPWDPPTEYADRYRDAVMPLPIEDDLIGKPAWQRKRAEELHTATLEDLVAARRQYAAMIELIDDQIGAILATLSRRGLADNTYVVYCSDHGEMLGDHGFFEKDIFYDPAVRVPLVLAGPGIPAGEHCAAQVELFDLYPTLLELVGAESPRGIDGRSFGHLIEDPRRTHRSATASTLLHGRCLRTDRFKYVESHNDLPELYDLREDPHEIRNLAAERSDLVAELRRDLARRLA